MAATALTRYQSAATCRWSREGLRFAHTRTGRPESDWICARDGDRRPIASGECEVCPGWEPFAAAVADSRLARPDGGIDSLLRGLTRLVVIGVALAFVAIGIAILTRPLMIPFAIASFLCAASAVGWVAFGHLPSDADRT